MKLNENNEGHNRTKNSDKKDGMRPERKSGVTTNERRQRSQKTERPLAQISLKMEPKWIQNEKKKKKTTSHYFPSSAEENKGHTHKKNEKLTNYPKKWPEKMKIEDARRVLFR